MSALITTFLLSAHPAHAHADDLLEGIDVLIASPALAAEMSFGLLWIGIAPLLLLLVLGYDTVSCSGKQQATAGMQLMGLRMQSKDGGDVTLAQAFMQSAGFYISVAITSFLILGVALLNAERRCLHDFISGTKFIRRR